MSLQNLITGWYLGAGYFGIVFAMALESCCIPLPSEIVMPLAGIFVATYPQKFSLIGVTIAGTIGCGIGSIAAYWIGRTGGRPLLLRYGRYILISQADSDRADRLFARHGDSVTFFSRLLPIVRTYISLPAGIAEMRFGRFVTYTLLGSLPWCLLLAFIGVKIGEQSKQLQILQDARLTTIFHVLDVVIAVVIVLAVAFYIYRHIKHDNAARAAAADRTSGTTSATPAGGMSPANGAAPRPRRPRPGPASNLETPDRPTMPDVKSVRPWPNRYAHPAEPAETGEAPRSARDK